MPRGLVLAGVIAGLLLLFFPKLRARARLVALARRRGQPEQDVAGSTGFASVGPVDRQEEPPAGPPESPGTTAPSL